MLTPATIIEKTMAYVQETLAHAEGGHDWWHVYRVWKTALTLAVDEPADMVVVELGALLHDIADAKFTDGDETIGPAKARAFLSGLGVNAATINHVVQIIQHISFKGGHGVAPFKSLELDIVQDADRLDAIGAIGIARAFNYGGFKNRPIYDPTIPPNLHLSATEYRQSTAPTINHFYEKLFLLKNRMNTTAGKRLAEERDAFMHAYIAQFYKEWEGG